MVNQTGANLKTNFPTQVVLLLLWTIFFHPNAYGQNLSGKLSFAHTGKTPVANARVRLISGEARMDAYSNDQGEFNFELTQIADKNTPTYIEVELPGYELLHPWNRYPVCTQHLHESIDLSLVKTGEIKRSTERLFQIAERYINDRYLDKISSQIEDRNNSPAGKLEFEKQRESALALAAFICQKLAYVDTDKFSPVYTRAFSFLEEGRVDKAISILDESMIEENIGLAKRNYQDNEAFRDSYNEWVNLLFLKAETAVFALDFDEAAVSFSQAVRSDIELDWNLFSYAYFLEQQGQLSKAKSHVESLLEPASCDPYLNILAKETLSLIYLGENRQSQSDNYLRQVQQDYSSINILPSYTSIFEQAQRCIQLGQIYIKRENDLQAKVELEKALASLKQIGNQFPNLYRDTRIDVLRQLGEVELRMGNTNQAYKHWDKIRLELKAMANLQPNIYSGPLANTLLLMGNTSHKQYDMDRAEGLFKQALASVELVSSQYPKTHQALKADILIALGLNTGEMGQADEAEKFISQGTEIYRMLAMQYPKDYRSDLVDSYLKISDYYVQVQNYKKAWQKFHAVEEIISSSPSLFEKYESKLEKAVSELHIKEKNYPEARTMLAYQADNDLSGSSKVQMYAQQGDVQLMQYEYEAAIMTLQKGLNLITKNDIESALIRAELMSKIGNAYAGMYRAENAINYFHKASVGLSQLEYTRSMKTMDLYLKVQLDYIKAAIQFRYWEKAWELMENAEQHIDKFQVLTPDVRAYRTAQLNLYKANWFHSQDQSRSAIVQIRKAQQYWQSRMKKVSVSEAEEYSLILQVAARVYMKENYLKDAFQMLESAMAYQELLMEQSYERYEPRLIEIYTDLGEMYGRNRQMMDAERYFEKAISVVEPHMQKNPEAFEPLFASIHNRWGRVAYGARDYEKALSHYQIARKILDEAYKNNGAPFHALLSENVCQITRLFLLMKQNELASEYAAFAASIAPDYTQSRMMRAHTFLLNDQFAAAENLYKQLAGTNYGGEPALQVMLDDLKQFEANGVSHKDLSRAKKVLFTQLNQM